MYFFNALNFFEALENIYVYIYLNLKKVYFLFPGEWKFHDFFSFLFVTCSHRCIEEEYENNNSS